MRMVLTSYNPPADRMSGSPMIAEGWQTTVSKHVGPISCGNALEFVRCSRPKIEIIVFEYNVV